MIKEIEHPMVTMRGFLNMQVCVPSCWTDERARDFLESDSPCGTSGGWVVRKGNDERVPCDERAGFVHIILEA